MAPDMINFRIVEEEILKKRRDSKAHYDKSASVEQRPINIGNYAYAKPPPRHRGNPWIYGEVIKKDSARSYTIRTPQGNTIRLNRVQLKPAAPPPTPTYQPQEAAIPATEDTRIHSTPLPVTPKQPQVNLELPTPSMKASQEIHKEQHGAAGATPGQLQEPPEPKNTNQNRMKRTRSGRIIKPQKD